MEVTGQFPRIDSRTLIVWSDADADVALDFSTIADAGTCVPNFTLERLPGVSHWVQEETPETVNQLSPAFSVTWNPMKKFDLIIFDCDGVLVDSETIASEILAEILAGHGIMMSPEMGKVTFLGQSVDDIRLSAETLSGILMPADWSIAYYARMIPELGERVTPIAGIADALDRLSLAGIRVCVGSNGPIAKIRATLTRTGLWERFDGHVYSAKSLARPKPAPDLFLHAAESETVPAGRCAVVEDSPTGVTAGLAAGMQVFAFCRPEQAAAMRELGATPFFSMTDLPGHLTG